MILVSACLVGKNTKYSGRNNRNENVINYLKGKEYILCCPEQLGGLTTPRLPAEIQGGDGADVLTNNAKIVNSDGNIVTDEFIIGAEEVLKLAKTQNVEVAILKAKSPSCGCGKIYDGSFNGKTIIGNGVTAELLLKNGIKVITEEDIFY